MGIESTKYGTWRVRWTDPIGKQISRSFKTLAEAEAFQSVVDTVREHGQPMDKVRPSRLTDEARFRVSSRGHHVYLLHDEDDKVVYVGRSSNVLKRIGDHLHVRGRRDVVASVSIIRCMDEDEMKQLEMALIYLHQPELNTRGLAGRPRRASYNGNGADVVVTMTGWIPSAEEAS